MNAKRNATQHNDMQHNGNNPTHYNDPWLDNCDIDFLNFCHCQVQIFENLNQSEWDQNLTVNFQKRQKRKQK